MAKHDLRAMTDTDRRRDGVLSGEEQEMKEAEVTYKNVVLIPLAAYDDGLYAAMLIVGELSGVQRASGVLGHFPCPVAARKYALAYGMAEIDERVPAEPEHAQRQSEQMGETRA